jgi:hypothetical protein
MGTLSIVAAAGSGDLLVGLLIGCCLGLLLGPAFRAWQIHREYTDASREAGLADQLLDRMALDLEDRPDPTDAADGIGEPAWPTRR